MKRDQDIPATDSTEIEKLRQRLRNGALDPQDMQLLDRLLGSFLTLLELLQRKNASIKRLKRWLFGPGADKRTSSTPPTDPASDSSAAATATADSIPADSTTAAKRRRRGHGRRRAADYSGATVVECLHPGLKPGDRCPHCHGHLYDTNVPAPLIRFTGQPIVAASRYDQQVLRCSSCQQRFTAPLPEGVPAQKYDATADVAIVLAKYAGGIPCYRLARLQEACGVPLSESVQFERCESVANGVLAVFIYLEKLAAQAELLHADDTKVKILSCLKENEQLGKDKRRGLQTTGIVAQVGEHQIALYRSGRRHAGENIDELLSYRPPGLGPPIQMGDAISANWSRTSETIAAKCLAHARRQFIDIQESFPTACQRVLDAIGEVYANERQSKTMTASQRLCFHQQHSAPVMESLRQWIDEQEGEGKVEPNCALGQAFAYLKRHWRELTTFLRVERTPLDNNAAERLLKRVVVNRKNSLFFKNEHGAAIGDVLLSVIETCRLNRVNAWAYLVEVVRHREAVRQNPVGWLPWNYPQPMPAAQAA